MADQDRHIADPNTWLDAYAELRPHGPGHASEWLGTPLAIAGLVGWLWSLPVPAAFSEAGPALNWATIFLMATVVYYFIMSISLAFGTLPFAAGLLAASAWLDGSGWPLAGLASLVFALALTWQLAECRRFGHRTTFFSLLQYLMIGPLWLLAAFYRRIGIPY